ncbi:hypothetical protein [Metamycoplasma neophronis]|uniref:Lipoprotein n=1 Tax=Metamycoplasma neophronis TaxID=872983 RepID=A0ABY2Z091_9BACT|nr:hypothetical protein [Metamycoplasma neophronis]TPR54290.1 hypothetical protein FJR74_00725 [Metamycoplasma neophronis]
MAKQEQNQDLIEPNEKKAKKQGKGPKIAKTFFMFAGILVPTVCVIAIPLALNKRQNYGNNKVFFDSKESIKAPVIEELKDNKIRVTFEQITPNEIQILSSNPREIEEKSKYDHLLAYQNTFSFIQSGYNFDSFFANNNKKTHTVEINQNNVQIFNIDILKMIEDFNKSRSPKNKVSDSFFIKSIDKVNTSMTYAYVNGKFLVYYDNAPGYQGYSTVNFFRSITTWLDNYRKENNLPDAIDYKLISANLSANVNLNDELSKVTSIVFNNKIVIELTKANENN